MKAARSRASSSTRERIAKARSARTTAFSSRVRCLPTPSGFTTRLTENFPPWKRNVPSRAERDCNRESRRRKGKIYLASTQYGCTIPPHMSANLKAQRDLSISGDVVGRDKIVNNIRQIYERALTAVEEAEQEKSSETKILAQGVSAFAKHLQARASETEPEGSGSPYKGLLEYRLSDAELFFGRSQAISELLENLGNGPLTILHAESGAGK